MSSLLTAAVELKPDLAKFKRETVKGVEDATKDAGKKLEKGMGDAGKKAGEKTGRDLGRGLEEEVGKGARKAGQKVETEMEKAGKAASGRFSSAFDRMDNLGNKMTLGVTLPLVAGFQLATTAAGNLNETLGASEQVFGSAFGSMKAWADGAMENLGLAASTVLGSANSMGAMFVGMGVQEDTAATMTQQLIERARDMAMLYNVSSEEMLTAIRSGMSGEMEPLKRFGVILSQTAVEAKAVSAGLVTASVDSAKLAQAQVRVEQTGKKAAEQLKKYGEDSLEYRDAAADVQSAEAALADVMAGKVGSIDQGTLAQARLLLLMEQSSIATGQYKREEDSLAATTERSKEEAKQLAEEYGQKLIPFKLKLLEAASKVMNVFSKMPEGMQNTIIAVAAFAALAGPTMKFVSVIHSMWTALVGLAARWGMVTTAANTAAVAQGRAAMAGGPGGAGRLGMLGKLGAAAAGAYVGYQGMTDQMDNGLSLGNTAATVGGFALTGAMIGSMIAPGVGTAIGGLIGGAAGIGVSVGNHISQGMADGGRVAAPGWSWVGENGPELAYMPKNAQVLPHRDSMALASAGTTVNNISMTVTVEGKQFDERTLALHLDALARKAAATNTRTVRSAR